MEQINKKPAVRFKGFAEEWEKMKLGEISEIGDGLHGTPKYVESGGVYFINGNNLISGKVVVTNETKQVTEKEQSNDDKRLNTNTILISINGTIGNLAFHHGEKIMLGKSVAYITLKNHNKNFVYSYLKTMKMRSHFFNSLTGSTIKNLGLKSIRETEIVIPQSEEQKKIGTYFKNIDHLISLRQKKYDQLVNIKKSMLEKMFPKNGAEVPEIRFKGFEGAWEKRKFGECVLIQRGGSPRPIEKFITNNVDGINWIKIGDVSIESRYITKTKQKIIPEGEKHSRRVQKGDLILSNSMSFGRPYIMAIDGCIHDGWLLIRDENKMFDLEYLLQLLSSDFMLKQYRALAAGGVVINLNSELVQSTNVFIPEINEQRKIGIFFTELDNLTVRYENQLKKLKQIKKACLEKMFV